MTTGSRAPPGTAYVVKRDVPPGRKSGPPVYITRKGGEIQIGSYTPNLADARRWPTRPAVWRWVKIRRGRPGHAGELDDAWYTTRA